MSYESLLHVFMIGLTMTLIPCPIMMILINVTIKAGTKAAIVVIISTVLSDTVLGIIGAVSFNNSLFTKYGGVIDIVSGMLFVAISYSELSKQNEIDEKVSPHNSLNRLFTQVAFLSLFSPIALACWVSTFSLSTTTDLTLSNASIIIISSILGSMLSWLTMSWALLKIRRKLSNKWLAIMRYTSCIFLGIFGAVSIVGL